MAKVEKVVLWDAVPPPGHYANPKAALTAEPTKLVQDNAFSMESQAKAAAKRLNDGSRAKKWPNDRYFAIYVPNPRPSEPEGEYNTVHDAWLVLIGVRPHIPEGWESFVDHVPRKYNKKSNKGSEDVTDTDAAEEYDEDSEDENVGEREHAHA